MDLIAAENFEQTYCCNKFVDMIDFVVLSYYCYYSPVVFVVVVVHLDLHSLNWQR